MARQAKGITFPITYKADLGGINKAEGALSKFGKLAAGIGAAAVTAVTSIAISGIKSFAEFDSKLNQSISIMGDVSDALRDDMANAAREVAKTTTFSAAEAAESFFFLASAGLDAEASISALPKVASFAQAGMFDMSRATDLLTDAQSALGLSSDDASENLENMARVGDVLVKANTIANASVEQFASSLTTKAAASMRTLNMEVEEGVAVLAVFADQGIKGEQAGTAFNATMIGLTKNARDNASAFEALGVEVFDSTGELNSMADIVGQLEVGFDGMTTEQKEAALAGLGLSRQALDGTKALLGNSEALREYEEELKSAGGTVEDVAEKQLQTLTGQMSLLKSAFEDVGLEVGKILVPVILDLVKELAPLVDEIGPAVAQVFTELAPILADIAKEIPGLVASFMPLIPVIGKIAEVFFSIISAVLPMFVGLIESLLPLFDELVPILADAFLDILTAAVPILLSLAEALVPVVMALLPPLVEVISALAPITLELINAFLPLINMVLPILTGAIQFLTPILTTVGRILSVVLAGAVNVFSGVLRGLGNFISRFASTFRSIFSGIATFFSAIFTGIGVVISGFRTALGGVRNFFGTVFGGIKRALETFRNAFSSIFDGVKRVFTGFVNSIAGGFERLINGIIGGLNGFIGAANKIKFDIPDWVPVLGGKQFGLNIPTLSSINIPRLAEGGIVDRETLAIIGEAGPEAVIPLDKMPPAGYTIVVNAGMGTDGAEVGRKVVETIRAYERRSGKVFASA